MRIGFVILLAIVLGLCTGLAAALAEFGYYDEVVPKLDVYAIPLRLDGPPPLLVIDNPKYEFADMEHTKVGSHVFEIRNEGGGDLVIDPAHRVCACTVSKINVGGKVVPAETKAVVPPGAVAKVTVEWRPLNAFGKFEKTLTFPTNDPNNRMLALSIHGKVVQAWRLMPDRIDFLDFGTDDTREATANLLVYQDEKWQIHGHKWTNDKWSKHVDLKYVAIPADELAKMMPLPKSGYKLTLTARKGMPLGQFSETVTLDTSPKQNMPIMLTVFGNVMANVALMRDPHLGPNHELYLGDRIPQGKAYNVELKIRLAGAHRKKTKFTIKKVTPEDLKVSLGDPKGDAVIIVPLKIEIPATAKPQAFLSINPEELGQIVIETTHPDVKELKLFARFAIVGPTAASPVPAGPKK